MIMSNIRTTDSGTAFRRERYRPPIRGRFNQGMTCQHMERTRSHSRLAPRLHGATCGIRLCTPLPCAYYRRHQPPPTLPLSVYRKAFTKQTQLVDHQLRADLSNTAPSGDACRPRAGLWLGRCAAFLIEKTGAGLQLDTTALAKC